MLIEMFRVLLKRSFTFRKFADSRSCKPLAIFGVLMLKFIATSKCCLLPSGIRDAVSRDGADRQCACDVTNFDVLPSCSPCSTTFYIATKGFSELRKVRSTFTIAYPPGLLKQQLGLNVKIVTLWPLVTEKACCDGAYVVLRTFARHRRRMPTAASQDNGVLSRFPRVALQSTSRALRRGKIFEEVPANDDFSSFRGADENCLQSDIRFQEAACVRASSLSSHLNDHQLTGFASHSSRETYVLRIREANSSNLIAVTRLGSAPCSMRIASLIINGQHLPNGSELLSSQELRVTLRHSSPGSTSYRGLAHFRMKEKNATERHLQILKRSFTPSVSSGDSQWSTRCTSSCVGAQKNTAATMNGLTATADSATRSERDVTTSHPVSWTSGHAGSNSSNSSAARQGGKPNASRKKIVISSTACIAVVALAVGITLGFCYRRRRVGLFAPVLATDSSSLNLAHLTKMLKFDEDEKVALLNNELYESALDLKKKLID